MAKNDIPHVFVLLINFDSPNFTAKCVDSVFASDYPYLTVGVLDQASSLDNYRKLRDLLDIRCRIWRVDRHHGYARGLNRLLQYASEYEPDYFLILDNDTILDPHAISELVKTAKRWKNRAVVTGKVYSCEQKNRLLSVGRRFIDTTCETFPVGRNEIDRGQYDEEMERESISNTMMLLPAAIYHRVGEYSPYFYLHSEQTDYIMRIRKYGFKAVYCPAAKIWHRELSLRDWISAEADHFYYAESQVILHHLHMTRWPFVQFIVKRTIQYGRSAVTGLGAYLLGRDNQHKVRIAQLFGHLSGITWMLGRPLAEDRYFLGKRR